MAIETAGKIDGSREVQQYKGDVLPILYGHDRSEQQCLDVGARPTQEK